MSKSLQDLSALQDVPLDETTVASLDDLRETGSYLPMLQPGVYTFQMPEKTDDLPWDTIEQEGKPQRVQIEFDDTHPLKITSATGAAQARVGEPFTTRVSNVPRERTFSGEKVWINDLLYLLKKLGHKVKPNNNREYLLAVSSYPGKQFRSAVNVSWSCNPKRNIRRWIPDPTNPAEGNRQEIEGQMGCGARYYPDGKVEGQPASVKFPTKGADGLFPEEVVCPKCGALLRGFANLDLVREA